MGPEATCELFRRVIQLTPARTDQEQVPIVINNLPQIPDRTAYIVGEGEDPLPMLLGGVAELDGLGVACIGIPCITAHSFLDELRRSVGTPIVDMLDETRAELPGGGAEPASRVGIIATDGSIRTRIFERYFDSVIYPDPRIQSLVMDLIYGEEGLKSGRGVRIGDRLNRIASHLAEQGAEVVVAGCTEISLVSDRFDSRHSIIDPLTALARVLVREARGARNLARGQRHQASPSR
jgi:aspartate racemase